MTDDFKRHRISIPLDYEEEEERPARRKLCRVDSRTFLDRIARNQATLPKKMSLHSLVSQKSILRHSLDGSKKAPLMRRRTFRSTAEAMINFRKSIFIFDRADMCLCGLLSLDLSVHLICCIEVFFSMVLLLQSPDLITLDGSYFYFLGSFEGCGIYLFLMHLIMCVSCVLTAILLYAGSKLKRPNLVIPHLLWQISFIILAISLSAFLLNLGLTGRMLLPSSIVLTAMLITPGLAEVWWSYLTFCFYHQLKRRISKQRTNGSICISLEVPSTEC